jgi:hypothetical protein
MDCGEANCDGRSAALLQGAGESWLGRDGDLELTPHTLEVAKLTSNIVLVTVLFHGLGFPSLAEQKSPQKRAFEVVALKRHYEVSLLGDIRGCNGLRDAANAG